MVRKLILGSAVGLCLLINAGSTHACDGYGGGFPAWGYDYAGLYRLMSANVPHFAAFPPVYYSEPVPRSYGYGPFAYPPHVRTPEIVAAPVQPVTIINPYVEQAEDDEQADLGPTASNQPPAPLMVYNPYINSTASVASTR